MQTILKAKGLVDVDQEVVIPHVVVIIDDDKITSIDNETSFSQNYPEGQLIDLSDHYILPGLINSHAHLCLEAVSHIGLSHKYRENLKELAVLVAARNSQKELMSGVTTVRDCGGWDMPVVCLAAKFGLFESPRIFHCGRLITMTGGHAWFMGEEADGVDAIIRSTRQNFKEGANFIKLMVTGGGTPNTFPGHASFSIPEISAAAETAHRIDRKVAVHARGIPGIKAAIKGGVDFIEHCCFELPDGTLQYDPQIAEEIAQKGIYVTPTIQLYRDRLRALIRKQEEEPGKPGDQQSIDLLTRVLAEKHLALKGFIDLGVQCIAGNDAGLPAVEFGSLSRELDSMVEGGMTPMQAIVAATKTPAEAMGLYSTIGSLEAGKQADIIAVGSDPTSDILALEKTSFVMKAGEVHLNSNLIKSA